MKYLVMETHPAYAVVLDEQGCYLKAANLRYEVGDMVGDIVELRSPAPKPLRLYKPLSGLVAAAACFCLVFFGYYTPNFTAYGTLRISINPNVQMTISRTDRVLELEGLNPDGIDLIAGYSFSGKSRDTAASELIDRAVEMGYLSDGATITIEMNSKDAQWQTQEETQVRQMLEDRYGPSVVIVLGDEENKDNGRDPMRPQENDTQVVVPVPSAPASSSIAPQPSQSQTSPPSSGTTNYGDTDYGDTTDNATDYGPYGDGDTDYDNDNSSSSDDDSSGDDGSDDDSSDDDSSDDDSSDDDSSDDDKDDS